jgi:hypothetical protein
VSSRKEQKERLRAERLERERAAATVAARKRRVQIGAGAIAAAAAVVVVAVLLIGSGGSSNNNGANASSSSSSDTGTQAGVQVTKAPWKPEYGFLAQRLSALNFPEQSDVGYHVHDALFLYVNGKPITIPANFGIDPQGRFIAPIHTHDATGVIHLESTEPYPFTLGQTFDIWGVKFTDTQLGAYTAGNGNVLQVWVNGNQISDPVNYKLKAHDIIVVGFGKPGSFPTQKSFSWTTGPGTGL